MAPKRRVQLSRKLKLRKENLLQTGREGRGRGCRVQRLRGFGMETKTFLRKDYQPFPLSWFKGPMKRLSFYHFCFTF